MRIGGDVARFWRDIESRNQARNQYLAEHERLDRMSTDLFAKGRVYEAAGAHYWAMVAFRASEAERNDPDRSVNDHDDRAREGWRR